MFVFVVLLIVKISKNNPFVVFLKTEGLVVVFRHAHVRMRNNVKGPSNFVFASRALVNRCIASAPLIRLFCRLNLLGKPNLKF